MQDEFVNASFLVKNTNNALARYDAPGQVRYNRREGQMELDTGGFTYRYLQVCCFLERMQTDTRLVGGAWSGRHAFH